jgi:hypothetical protein
MTPGTRDGENGQRQHRRIMGNFGGSGTIQGTEDLPVDPDIADVKAIGLAALFGFALMASVPRGLSIPIPYGIDSTVIGAIEAWNPFVAAFIPTLSTAIGLLAAGLCIAAAGTIVYLCPGDRTPIGWVRAIADFYRRPKRLTQDADAEHKRTQPITGLDRVLPISGAVRRDDGALVGMIEVAGRDMALAEDGEWRSVGKAYEGLADALDSRYDIFSPARTIDPARLSKGYIGREFDDDVRNNPTLSALIETYQNDLPREFRQRGTAVRRFYVVVWVTESEVRRQDHGLFAKLADLPVVGLAIRRVGLARREASDEEIRTRQKSILSSRQRTVENAVGSIEECTASEIDGEHFAAVLTEYWTGVRTPHDGKPVPNLSLPVVTTGEPDSEEPSETGGY